jgi:hypothetical protein
MAPPFMKPRVLILFAVPSILIAFLWLRSEFTTDLLMRRSPVPKLNLDSSRGIISTRGCIMFRRILISPSCTTRPVWDWTTTSQSQLPDNRTPANRLGFGQSSITLTANSSTFTLADSWFPYWLAEIIAVAPLLIAIPFVGSAPPSKTVRNADPT